MLFKRQHPPSRWKTAREYLWPRIGFKRAWLYLWHRVRRIDEPPHNIALGFAVGAFMSFTPLFGFHIVVAAVLALILGGNVLASAIGTFVGNPITFPFIWVATFNVGAIILGMETRDTLLDEMEALSQWSAFMEPARFFSTMIDILEPILLPMLVGSIPLGLAGAVLCYALVRPGVRIYQEQRRNRFRRSETAGDGS